MAGGTMHTIVDNAEFKFNGLGATKIAIAELASAVPTIGARNAAIVVRIHYASVTSGAIKVQAIPVWPSSQSDTIFQVQSALGTPTRLLEVAFTNALLFASNVKQAATDSTTMALLGPALRIVLEATQGAAADDTFIVRLSVAVLLFES